MAKETQSKLEKDNRELLNEISSLNKKLKEKEDVISSKDAKIDIISRYVACTFCTSGWRKIQVPTYINPFYSSPP